jgi:hypothetical protein
MRIAKMGSSALIKYAYSAEEIPTVLISKLAKIINASISNVATLTKTRVLITRFATNILRKTNQNDVL